jgi:enterobactin synthetase component D
MIDLFANRFFPLLRLTPSHFSAERPAADTLDADLAGAIPIAVARVSSVRQADFRVGRLCARYALKHAGHTGPFDLPIGESRAPVWPAGFIGCITHTRVFAAAAVARCNRVAALGIDSEQLLSDEAAAEIAHQVLTPDERQRGLAGHTLAFGHLVALVFSAKESLYKCVQPLVGQWIDFHDAEIVRLDPTEGAFDVRLRRGLGGPLARGSVLQGHYGFSSGLVHTAIEMSAAAYRFYPSTVG